MGRFLFYSFVLIFSISAAPYMSLAQKTPDPGVDLDSGIECGCLTRGTPIGASPCYHQSIGGTDYGTCYNCQYLQSSSVTAALPIGDCKDKLDAKTAKEICKMVCLHHATFPAYLSINNRKCEAIPGYSTNPDKEALLREAIRACNEDQAEHEKTCISEGQKRETGAAFIPRSCADLPHLESPPVSAPN